MKKTVVYKPFDGAEGLELASEDRELVAWSGGKEVGRAPLRPDEDIASLMRRLRPPEIFTDLSFIAPGAQEPLEIDVEVEVRSFIRALGPDGYNSRPEEAWGYVSYEDRSLWWEGEYTFYPGIISSPVPVSDRAWTDPEGSMVHCWKLILDREISGSPDWVLLQRLARTIEEALQQYKEGGPDVYRTKISNVFSAQNPVWIDPPPLIFPH